MTSSSETGFSGFVSKRAEVYARALFDLSPTETALKSLKTFKGVFQDPRTAEFLRSPLISPAKKTEIIKKTLTETDSLVRNFILLLTNRRRTELLSEICVKFQNLLNDKSNRLQGTVATPRPLSKEEKAGLEKALTQHFGKTVQLEEILDPRLIGGVCITAGDFIFNDSLKFHLDTFQTAGGQAHA